VGVRLTAPTDLRAVTDTQRSVALALPLLAIGDSFQQGPVMAVEMPATIHRFTGGDRAAHRTQS
jgi:hypothetical protein